MSCATVRAIADARRGEFDQALRHYPAEIREQEVAPAASGPSSSVAAARRGVRRGQNEQQQVRQAAASHGRHVAEIVTAWAEALRFQRAAPGLPQPSTERIRGLVQSFGGLDAGGGLSNGGGWDARANAALRAGDGRCNIDVRRPGVDLTARQFQQEYLLLNRPVVLRGLCSRWPAVAASNTTASTAAAATSSTAATGGGWSRERLLERFGDVRFVAKRGSEIARDKVHAADPAAAEGIALRNRKITLHQFVSDVLDARSMDNLTAFLADEDPRYILDRPPPAMFDAGDFPSLLEPWFPRGLSFSRQQRDEQALVFIGGANSGTALHAHTNAWNALFFGRKRWFLVPPHLAQAAFAGARKNTTKAMATWLREDYPQLRDALYECTQEAGDVVYAPSYYEHAVLNVQDSLGVAIQVGNADGLGMHAARFARQMLGFVP